MNFILHYQGSKFDPNGKFIIPGEESLDSKTEKLAARFSNIGALVIRYHIGQGQRAGLIQQAARPHYDESRVEQPAKGGNESGLFKAKFPYPECTATAKLEQCAHATLGRGKVLNERAQPLVKVNTQALCGEQRLWDLMHTTVWNCGISLPYQLNHQGFTYVCCSKEVDEVGYQNISEALMAGDFTIQDDTVIVDKYRLPTASMKDLQIALDPDHLETYQENGIAISHPMSKGKEPLGWLVHRERKKAISQTMFENLVRITKIAKGGFYELSKREQALLQSGALKNADGTGLFTNNQAFNALYPICKVLEEEFGFDPEKLMGNSLTVTYQRVQEFLSEPVNLDDFLTGALLTEMVQSLKVSKSNSERTQFPLRFTNPFSVQHNNTKAIAHAFGIKDSEGSDILRLDHIEPINEEEGKLDVSIIGKLAYPSFTYGRHAAAVLSLAILVAEEMLLEQLLKDAFEDGKVGELLKKIMMDQDKADSLALALATDIEVHGISKFGLQYPESEPILKILRKELGFNSLFSLIEILSKEGIKTKQALNELRIQDKQGLLSGFQTLNLLGKVIQEDPRTSAATEQSAGIHAGLAPLLLKMIPERAEEIGLTLDDPFFATVVEKKKEVREIVKTRDAPPKTIKPISKRPGLNLTRACNLMALIVGAVGLAAISLGQFVERP